MDGLQEFALMVAHSGTVNLLDQLGIFVDEPRLPQHISCCVFYLRETQHTFMKLQKKNQIVLNTNNLAFSFILLP